MYIILYCAFYTYWTLYSTQSPAALELCMSCSWPLDGSHISSLNLFLEHTRIFFMIRHEMSLCDMILSF